jgi:hypothetical protein
MKEISPEFNVSREEFCGGNRETYWKNIFDFKRLRVSKQTVFTGLIETDGVAMCVHNRRLKADRLVPPSAVPVTMDKEKEEADPATQKVQHNDLVVNAAMHEEKKQAGPETQEVEDNVLVVDAAMHEEKKQAGPETQEVEDNVLVVDAAMHEEKKEAGPVT